MNDLQKEPIWADGFQRLVTFGRNRSGIDSGELDFSIASYRVDSLSPKDKDELVRLLRAAADIIERQTPPTPEKESCEHEEWGYEHVRQEYVCLDCMETRKETPNPPEEGL